MHHFIIAIDSIITLISLWILKPVYKMAQSQELINDEQGLINNQQGLINDEQGLINDEQGLIDNEQGLINNENAEETHTQEE